MKKTLIPLVLILYSCFGCASFRSQTEPSWVPPDLNFRHAMYIAVDAGKYLSKSLPPAKTTLVLMAPHGRDPITHHLEEVLRDKGFGVVRVSPGKKKVVKKGTPLQYRVTQYDDGLLLRLRYGDTEASRWYRLDKDGWPSPSAPFTIRTDEGGKRGSTN